MKKSTSLLLLLGVFITAMLSGCSGFGAIEEPLTTTPDPTETITVANGDHGTTGKINDVPTVTPQERRDPEPVTVPRVTQGNIIGVVRELRANGCLIQKVATTDSIQYSQLVVTCSDPQDIPSIQ